MSAACSHRENNSPMSAAYRSRKQLEKRKKKIRQSLLSISCSHPKNEFTNVCFLSLIHVEKRVHQRLSRVHNEKRIRQRLVPLSWSHPEKNSPTSSAYLVFTSRNEFTKVYCLVSTSREEFTNACLVSTTRKEFTNI